MEQIDNEILTRCQRGDKTAFKWVVERYQQMLFSLSLKMLGDEEEAKDVVQEVHYLALHDSNKAMSRSDESQQVSLSDA